MKRIEEVKKEIINIIGTSEANRLIQMLDNQYLGFNEEGYITNSFYIDYSDINNLEEYIQDNYIRFNNIDELIDNILGLYWNDEYYLFEPINNIINILDIDAETNIKLTELLQDNFYVEYDNIIDIITNAEVRFNIDLCNQYGENGHQLIKKYIPKYWNTLKKDEDFNYYSYTLSTTVKMNIQDFYNFKKYKRVKIVGKWILKDGVNGKYYHDYILDNQYLEFNVSIKNIQDIGYTIEEIGGDEEYYTSQVIGGVLYEKN